MDVRYNDLFKTTRVNYKMLGSLVVGASGTVAVYKGYKYIFPKETDDNFEDFLRFEDVRSTIITVGQFLKKNKEFKQLAAQHKIIKLKLHEIDQLIEWRKKKMLRYFAYTGEKQLIRNFREEWIIFKVRIRVVRGLNQLEFYK